MLELEGAAGMCPAARTLFLLPEAAKKAPAGAGALGKRCRGALLERAVEGAHVDDAVHAVGIEGGAQAEDAHEGDDGLEHEGHAAHVGKAEHHAAEDDAHPVELGLHEDDGGTGHVGVFPGPDGGDGRDDQHDPQADAQGQIEAAVGVLLMVFGFAEHDELAEHGTENDSAEREEEDGEEAGSAEQGSGDGVDDLDGDADGAAEPCAYAEYGRALGAAVGAEEQDKAGRLGHEPDIGGDAAEADTAGDEGYERTGGRGHPAAAAGVFVVIVFPPREEGEAGGELGENSEENERPVGDHGKLPAEAVE